MIRDCSWMESFKSGNHKCETENHDGEMIGREAKKVLRKIEQQDHVTIQALFIDLQNAVDQLPIKSLGRDSWVLEQLKNSLELKFTRFAEGDIKIKRAEYRDQILERIKDLESQDPEFGLEVLEVIDNLPAKAVKSRAEIERAIETLERLFDEMKAENHPFGSYWKLRRNINLLNYILNQPQEEKGYSGSTWTDKELLGENRGSQNVAGNQK